MLLNLSYNKMIKHHKTETVISTQEFIMEQNDVLLRSATIN